MLRTHHCGALSIKDIKKEVTLCGWVQKSRDLGGMNFIDLRDRYGITQLAFNQEINKDLYERSQRIGREFVLQVKGLVIERSSKNLKIPTGEIEIEVRELVILNESKVPPFTIEDETDGGEELRMKYRYLDLRRPVIRKNLELRHRLAQETRNYLNDLGFIEVETPVLIKSTPEGARDYIVPSRIHKGQFYALPQSPQTFKQLLMVAGYDRYYQIVKCFRDEDLRADRQPEFTQIDCEMSFIEQEDILNTFEGWIRHLFKSVKNIELPSVPRISFDDALKCYGTDKPDTRFEMKFFDLSEKLKKEKFNLFDQSEVILGIAATGCAGYTRKQVDELTELVKGPKIGAGGLVYIRYNTDGSVKSSIDKYFNEDELKEAALKCGASPGDLVLILAGAVDKTRKSLSELRLEMGTRLGLRDQSIFSCLWVVDFPLLERNEEENRWQAVHHPFTAPKPEDIHLLDSHPAAVRANCYDMVINGVEMSSGSIRIHDKGLQSKMFDLLGFSREEAELKFGFLMNAFEFGAPPHGGIAFGFDRLCSVMGGAETIRDFIAFPKNNAAKDVMIDSPSPVNPVQLKELGMVF